MQYNNNPYPHNLATATHVTQISDLTRLPQFCTVYRPPIATLLSLLSPLTHKNHDIAFDPQKPYIHLRNNNNNNYYYYYYY